MKWGRLGAQEKFDDLKPRFGVDARFIDVPAPSISEGLREHFEAQPVDLAVLATTPHSGLSFWFAGSISRRALREAEAMILFVREGQRGFVDPATGALQLKKVLIPLDGKTPIAPALARAARLWSALGLPLEMRFLHIGDVAPADAPKEIPITLARGPCGRDDPAKCAIVESGPDLHADAGPARRAVPLPQFRQRGDSGGRPLAGSQRAGAIEGAAAAEGRARRQTTASTNAVPVIAIATGRPSPRPRSSASQSPAGVPAARSTSTTAQ